MKIAYKNEITTLASITAVEKRSVGTGEIQRGSGVNREDKRVMAYGGRLRCLFQSAAEVVRTFNLPASALQLRYWQTGCTFTLSVVTEGVGRILWLLYPWRFGGCPAGVEITGQNSFPGAGIPVEKYASNTIFWFGQLLLVCRQAARQH